MPRNSVKSLSKIPNSRKTITSAKSKSKSIKSANKSISKIKLVTKNTRTRKSLSKIVEDPDVPESMMMSLEKKPSIEVPTKKAKKNIDMSAFIRIYRKVISNLKIREDILRSIPSKYKVGPTIIWTEIPEELSIFTTDESYKNYIGFEGKFAVKNSPKYLKKIIKNMRMTKGTILIKEAPDKEASIMNIKIHFCGYRIDKNGKLFIFDPSWHSADKGIYSTTAFYDELKHFGIKEDINYEHAEPNRAHYWQSLLKNDVFCQTWSLRWLYYDDDKDRHFKLPDTDKKAANQIAKYIRGFSDIILNNIEKYMSVFPAYKLEGHDPKFVFKTLSDKPELELTEIIYIYFKDKVVEDVVEDKPEE
jgi:hypothetical protein